MTAARRLNPAITVKWMAADRAAPPTAGWTPSENPNDIARRDVWAYSVKRLIAAHGADAKLTELLVTLANCEKARSFSIYDRCKARFEGFSFRA
jgi:hypothetical protein